jgi:hydrogenase maturation factor
VTSDARFHCVTCSDEATPLRVVEVRDDGTALCDGDVEVMTDLVGRVERGETLLVHAGVALERVAG